MKRKKNKRYYFGKKYPGGGQLVQLATQLGGAGLDALVPGLGTILSSVTTPIIGLGQQHKQVSEQAQQAYNEVQAQTNPYMKYGGLMDDHTSVPNPELGLHIPYETEEFKKGGWIQKATASIKRRGTEGVCTGEKFGSSSCPPGSKRYNLAKTFRKMAKNREEGGEIGESEGYMNASSMEDAYSFTGNTHEQGGIGISDEGLPSGQPHAEIEGDEVVVNFVDSEGKPRKYVFSKRLKV